MKKIISILISLFLLVSCFHQEELKEIEFRKMFEVNLNKYLVYFYSPTCKACTDTLELLIKRYQNKKYEVFLLKTNDLKVERCSRETSNLFVNNYQNVVISTLPYLVFIEEKMIVKELFGYTQIHKENLYIFFE